MTSATYDEVPYLSYAIRATHVANLHLIGRLFGMQPADCRSCRVLEIGGASGGNLIPMAAALPRSEFICLEPSVQQVEQGRRHAAELGLKNIRFEATTVEKFKPKGGFDYIVCHGVFSWVPPPVQEGIFAALQSGLTANGIAIVSYKALPGWHGHRALREVLLHHCAPAKGPMERARMAQQMLGLLERSAQDPGSAWGPLLLAEIQRLRAEPDALMLHDTLEEHNEAFYFKDFMARAHRRRLQFLGEANVRVMYVANPLPCIPPAVAERDDVEEMEQYIDFGLNRLFRQTLLCHESVALERGLVLDSVDGLYIQSLLLPEESGTFRASSGVSFTAHDPVVAEILALLARQANLPVSAQTAFAEFRARFPDTDAEALRTSFRKTVLRAFFAGGMRLQPLPPSHVASVSERPLASAVARHEAQYRSVVTNARHEAVVLTAFERTLLQKLEGNKAVQDLERDLGNEVRPVLDRLAASALLYG